MKEQFSAFLDNEATRDETDSVVNNLLRDESMRESWCRQHWIRETLRTASGETTVGLDLAFSERVMHAIREADPDTDDTVEAESETVVPMSRPMPRPKQRHRWRSMAGFAVAASAAGVALFVAEPLLPGRNAMLTPSNVVETPTAYVAESGAGTAAAAGTSQTSGLEMAQTLAMDRVQNVSTYETASEAAMDHWQVSNPVLANRLNGYLVEHNGMGRAYGLGVTTPGFIRVATYGQGTLGY